MAEQRRTPSNRPGKPGGGRTGSASATARGGRPGPGKPATRSSGGKPGAGKPGAGKPGAGKPGAGKSKSSQDFGTGPDAAQRQRVKRSAGTDSSLRARRERPSTGGGPSKSRVGEPSRRDSAGAPAGRSPGRQAPWVSEEITGDELDRQTINELRTLPEGLASAIARHLVAIEQALEEEDYAVARAHSDYVRKHAGRVAAVREACAIVHYASGEFAQALSDFRAVSRMRGGNTYLPIMADCERGLGRPQRAVDLLRGLEGPQVRGAQTPDVSTRVEGLIVLAGARADLGQAEAAALTLKVPDLTRLPAGTPRARLQYAYAEALLRIGRTTQAQEWMERAAGSDINGATDAEDRCQELAALNG